MHCNIVWIEKDGETLFKEKIPTCVEKKEEADRSLLSVKGIVDFAEAVQIEDVKEILDRQITYNYKIALEGLEHDWGANIGSILLKTYGDDVKIKCKAMAAAGSDARMSGCELPVVINSGSGNQGIQLRVDRGGCVLPVNGDGLPLLEYLSETLRQVLGCFAYHLAAEDVTDRILDYLRLLVTVVTGQLREVLKAETDRNLVASGGGYQVVYTTKINGRKLVNDDGTLQLSLLVHQLHDTGIVESQCRRIDVLAVGIVAHAKDLRVFRIVQIQSEIIACHDPVKLR